MAITAAQIDLNKLEVRIAAAAYVASTCACSATPPLRSHLALLPPEHPARTTCVPLSPAAGLPAAVSGGVQAVKPAGRQPGRPRGARCGPPLQCGAWAASPERHDTAAAASAVLLLCRDTVPVFKRRPHATRIIVAAVLAHRPLCVLPVAHNCVCPLLQAVDEDETLIRFAIACRRNGQRLALSGAKKPRAGSVRPRGR